MARERMADSASDGLTLAEAQHEVRTVFVRGGVGQLVSGTVWLVSAATAIVSGENAAMIALFVGGMFIFPPTQLGLKLSGRRASLSRDNPLGSLAQQIAFTVPITLPLAIAAALYRPSWFYPACMVIVGAHYLPFIFLYGMRAFGALAVLLIAGGFTLALTPAAPFAAGAWITAACLYGFAVWAALAGQRERSVAGS